MGSTLHVIDDGPVILKPASEASPAGGHAEICREGAEQLPSQLVTQMSELLVMDAALLRLAGLELIHRLKADPRYRNPHVFPLNDSAFKEHQSRTWNDKRTAYFDKTGESRSSSAQVMRELGAAPGPATT